MLLYHGSPFKIIGSIDPHIAYDITPYVYATSDYNYALVRCGAFSYDDVAICEDYDGHTYTLCELRPGAFKEIFDHDGWIYTFMGLSDFAPNGLVNEYISATSHNPDGITHISNVLHTLRMNPTVFKLIYFEDDQSQYWASVSGGKAGYLERKMQRNAEHNALLGNTRRK